MKKTDQTLLEQMRITDFEIEGRLALFDITAFDCNCLLQAAPAISHEIDELVNQFYEKQTNIPEIALLIGDSETLGRLTRAQLKYIADLFSGHYDVEYVNNRLRIGLVHKRIGVDPKLYLAGVQTLKSLLIEVVNRIFVEQEQRDDIVRALEKLFVFDISLVFDTYIRSLISEIEISKDNSDKYAQSLEEKVRQRTRELEAMSRTDPLTGLQNTRHLSDVLADVNKRAESHGEAVTLVYLDINDFKVVNDVHGHLHGDDVLRTVANAIKKVSRSEDYCFRYGGDEFCILMGRCTKDQAIEVYGKRLIKEINKQESGLTLSIGYAQSGPDNYLSTEALIREADEKMYVNKRLTKPVSEPLLTRQG